MTLAATSNFPIHFISIFPFCFPFQNIFMSRSTFLPYCFDFLAPYSHRSNGNCGSVWWKPFQLLFPREWKTPVVLHTPRNITEKRLCNICQDSTARYTNLQIGCISAASIQLDSGILWWKILLEIPIVEWFFGVLTNENATALWLSAIHCYRFENVAGDISLYGLNKWGFCCCCRYRTAYITISRR